MTDNPTPNDIALLREALKRELERQCGMGAGTLTIDEGYLEATGLWQINIDLDPRPLFRILADTLATTKVEVPSNAKAPIYRSQCQCVCHRNEPGIAIAHFAPCCLPEPVSRNSEGATDNGLPPLTEGQIAEAVSKWCSATAPGQHDGALQEKVKKSHLLVLREAIERLFDQAFTDGIAAGKSGDESILAGSSEVYAQAAIDLIPGQHDGAAGESCDACGGNGFSGGKVPASVELDDACEVCFGWGEKPKPSTEQARAAKSAIEDAMDNGDAFDPVEVVVPYSVALEALSPDRQGYVLVPRMPTYAMYEAAAEAWRGALSTYWANEIWTAMLDAAATPSGADALGDRL